MWSYGALPLELGQVTEIHAGGLGVLPGPVGDGLPEEVVGVRGHRFPAAVPQLGDSRPLQFLITALTSQKDGLCKPGRFAVGRCERPDPLPVDVGVRQKQQPQIMGVADEVQGGWTVASDASGDLGGERGAACRPGIAGGGRDVGRTCCAGWRGVVNPDAHPTEVVHPITKAGVVRVDRPAEG